MWRLEQASQFSVVPLMAHHNHLIMMVAITLAIIAAWVFLPIRDRYYSTFKNRFTWLLLGSVAMGVGIWAMHFTAMLAYQLPIPVEYNISITLISMVPAIVAVGGTILLYNSTKLSSVRFHLMALSLALGIGAMHYTGMEAIIAPADMFYDPFFFVLSLFAAYVFALVGLYTRIYLANKKFNPAIGTVIGSVILGMGVSSMHFTAMHATFFIPLPDAVITGHQTLPYELITSIIVAATFLLFLVLFGALIDSRIEAMSVSLKNSQFQFEQLVESSHDAIIGMNLEGQVTSWNQAAENIFGYSANQMIGQPITRICPEDKLAEANEVLAEIMSGDHVHHLQTVRINAEGKRLDISATISPIYDDQHTIIGISSISRDISEQVAASKLIEHRANFDELTGLPNRSHFYHRIRELINQADPKGFALFYLDLDHFKDVNDSLGHDLGDKLLQHISRHIKRHLRHADYLARFGGDEFVGIINDLQQADDIHQVTHKIIENAKTSFIIDGKTINTSVSMGVALYPSHGRNARDLLKNADRALYEAKRLGRNQYEIYNDDIGHEVTTKIQIADALALASVTEEFALHYQPIINLSSGRVEKAEALLRWHHPQLGHLSPDKFIPIAEESGHISKIGQWVFEQVTAQLPLWLDIYGDNFQVSINKSPVQINLDDLRCLQQLAKAHSYSTANLVIEITENTLLQHNDLTKQRLHSFRNAGVELAIDDFGTGYSSLSYLNKFEVDYIKLDKSFIQQLADGEANVKLCDAIIYMAHKLGMKVVAEGIETEAQHGLLASIGCDYAQGYYYSKPLTSEHFARFSFNPEQTSEQVRR